MRTARSGLRSAALLTLTATLAALLQAPSGLPGAVAADPVRVLVVGDSLTAGIHGDYTWRYRLWKEFGRQGTPVDFVGSNTWPYVANGYTAASYADPNFDHDHFAWGGAQLQNQSKAVEGEVRAQNADVVVLASGLNDLVHGGTAEATADLLRTFVENARVANPAVKIVVSPVLTINRSTMPTANALITRYDQLAAGVAAEVSTADSPVQVAPTLTGWSPNAAMVQDGIHLTPRGEWFVAQRIAMGLHAASVLPGVPPTPPTSVPWVRNLRPAVTVSGRNAVVSWDAQGLTSALITARRGKEAWRQVGSTTRHPFTYALTPGARYEFRVQGVRRVMSSTVSATVALTAPPLGRVTQVRVLSRKVTWAPVYGALQYHVRFHRPGSRSWHVKTVRTTTVKVRAAVAQVSARNTFTSSAPTTGRR